MRSIASVQTEPFAEDEQDTEPYLEFDGEPPAAELEAIERESPVIRAEVELLDVQISVLDRPVSEMDVRRLRRARRRLLTARRQLTNRAVPFTPGSAA